MESKICQILLTIVHVVDARPTAVPESLSKMRRGPVQRGLRHNIVVPCLWRKLVETREPWYVHVLDAGGVRSGFEKNDTDTAILRELIGENEASWAAANDYVVLGTLLLWVVRRGALRERDRSRDADEAGGRCQEVATGKHG